MSLTFKLLSLVIRTAAKPIGNYIKRQAKEHDGFRRFAINQAQRVHRIDMRMRLGLLHDAEAQQRMHEREQRAAEEKKRKAETPTVRNEEEQKKYDEQKEKEGSGKKKKDEQPKVKIRPLSDARAIELGANFFSEAFIFMVAVGLLLAENYRSSRKANNRRDEVQERLETLEEMVERLRNQHHLPELEALNEKLKKAREVKTNSWFNPAGWWRRTQPEEDSDVDDDGTPGETEGEHVGRRIPGSVPGPSPEKAIKSSGPKDAASDVKGTERPSTSAAPARVDTARATQKER